MDKRKKLLLLSFLPNILVIIGYLIAYPYLPDIVISHIGPKGIDMSSKFSFIASTFWPLGACILATLSIFYYNPRGYNDDQKYRYSTVSNFIISGIGIITFYIFLYIQLNPELALNSNNKPISSSYYNNLIPIIIGSIIMISGLLLRKVKRGYPIGIRTRSALSSEIVWEKTHKLAQVTVSLAGLLMIIYYLIPLENAWYFSGPTLLIGVIIPAVYARYLYGKNQLEE